jgi:hypothetical protein
VEVRGEFPLGDAGRLTEFGTIPTIAILHSASESRSLRQTK